MVQVGEHVAARELAHDGGPGHEVGGEGDGVGVGDEECPALLSQPGGRFLFERVDGRRNCSEFIAVDGVLEEEEAVVVPLTAPGPR